MTLYGVTWVKRKSAECPVRRASCQQVAVLQDYLNKAISWDGDLIW
ncbi:hypothetical protein SCARR_01057 [Pontiella sulfatireligans]|uniref:Uncharacterized protein n=1 Tax=Pontiella sulfatireligans TaxID=2750658 RepID=A0A6C2UGL8_9BACT|nr:hypothetical protein SCARR_01057 [Pontiella sulfatireligans]